MLLIAALAIVGAVGIAFSSFGEDRPEITIEDKLERIAGEDLTPAEIQRQLQVASTLCQSDIDVLSRMWDSMTAQQLRFQDYVFGTHCPIRSIEYAVATGRSLTVEAHEYLSGDNGTPPSSDSTDQTLPLPSSLFPTTGTTQP